MQDLVVRGVVDRDYPRNDAELPPNIIALKLHDLEAYLCLPKVLALIGAQIGGNETESDYEAIILEHAEAEKKNTIIRHADACFPTGGNITVPRPIRDKVKINEIVKTYITQRDELISSVSNEQSDEIIEERVSKIKSKIDIAITNEDISAILTWYSGKPLFEKLKKIAKLTDKTQAIKTINKHDIIEQVSELSDLRTMLRELFPD